MNSKSHRFLHWLLMPRSFAAWLSVAFLLSGCSVFSTDKHSASRVAACTYVPAHVKEGGLYVEAGYQCPLDSARSVSVTDSCLRVDEYRKNDGGAVAAHYRCRNNPMEPTSPPPVAPNYSNVYSPYRGLPTKDAPCVSGYCGPINVKGHYRKDGTYVRPHTRSRR